MSIKNHNQVGDCDLCGACGVNIKDLDEFEDFFIELLCLFNKDDNGEDIVSCIQRDWDIFADDKFASIIINYFLNKNNSHYQIQLYSILHTAISCFVVTSVWVWNVPQTHEFKISS